MNSVGCQLAIGQVLSYIFITWLLASNEGVVDKLPQINSVIWLVK